MTVTAAASKGETCAEDPRGAALDTAGLVDRDVAMAPVVASASDGTAPPDLGTPVGWRSDVGMATAEYAIATVAAAGFAGLLLVILRSNEVRALLLGIIRGALSV